MALFSNWFKKKSSEEEESESTPTPTAPPTVPAAKPAAPSVAQAKPAAAISPSQVPVVTRNIRTVVPNTVKPMSLRDGTATQQIPTARPASRTSVISMPGMGSSAPAAFSTPPPVAEEPAPAPEPPPAVSGRPIVLELGDFLDRIPGSFLKPGPFDLKRRVEFKAGDLFSDLSKGRASVPASIISNLVPDIFIKPVSETEDIEIQLPLQKLVEQIGEFQQRSDQIAPEKVAEIETPFLQVAKEDQAKFPKSTPATAAAAAVAVSTPPASAPAPVPAPAVPRPAAPIAPPPVAAPVIPPPVVPAAEVPSPVQPAGPIAPPTRRTAAPIIPGKRPPATVRASVSGGKIRLSGPALPSRMTAVTNQAQAPKAVPPIAPPAPPPVAPAPVAPPPGGFPQAASLRPVAAKAVPAPPTGLPPTPKAEKKVTRRIQIPGIQLKKPEAETASPAATPFKPPTLPTVPAASAPPAPVVPAPVVPPAPKPAPTLASPPPSLAPKVPAPFPSTGLMQMPKPATPVAPPQPVAPKVSLPSVPAVTPPPVEEDPMATIAEFPEPAAPPPPAPVASVPAPAPVAEVGSEPTISLNLKAILEGLPGDAVSGDLDRIDDNAQVVFPFSMVESQLSLGRVGIPVGVFVEAMPENLRRIFQGADPEAEVPIPLQEIFQSLPSDALKLRNDQIAEVVTEEIPTPFSQKANEDKERLAAQAREAAVKAKEEAEAEAKAEAERLVEEPTSEATPVEEPVAEEVPTAVEPEAAEVPEPEPVPEPVVAEAEPVLPPPPVAPTIPAVVAPPPIAPVLPPPPVPVAPLPSAPIAPPAPKPVAFSAPPKGIPVLPPVGSPMEDPAAETIVEPVSLPVVPPPPLQTISSPVGPSKKYDPFVLQAIFMTEEPMEARSIARKVTDLPGIKGCLIMFGDGLLLAGTFPETYDTPGICAMAPLMFKKIELYTQDLKLGSVQTFTIFSDESPISFFQYENLCVSVLHGTRGFLPGIREKLVEVTREVSKMYSATNAS